MKEPNAFNVYIVGTVDGEAHVGNTCFEPDIAVVGSSTLWGTMLHEIGHNLSLKHIDSHPAFKVGKKKNLMFSDSYQRRFLSEGQVFQMHFSNGSALNQTFPGLESPLARNCNLTAPDAPCPDLETRIWADQ